MSREEEAYMEARCKFETAAREMFMAEVKAGLPDISQDFCDVINDATEVEIKLYVEEDE